MCIRDRRHLWLCSGSWTCKSEVPTSYSHAALSTRSQGSGHRLLRRKVPGPRLGSQHIHSGEQWRDGTLILGYAAQYCDGAVETSRRPRGHTCLLYTSDAADDLTRVVLGG